MACGIIFDTYMLCVIGLNLSLQIFIISGENVSVILLCNSAQLSGPNGTLGHYFNNKLWIKVRNEWPS